MRLYLCTLLSVVFFTAAGVPCRAQAPAIDIKVIEARALAARQTIRNGYVHLESRSMTDNRKSDPKSGQLRELQSDFQFWFTKDRLRLDLLQKRLNSTVPATKRIECINYDGKGKDFQHTGDITSLAYQSVGMKLRKELYQVFDPRTIGYSTLNLNSLRQSSKLGKFGYREVARENVKSEKGSIDGVEMIRISWDEPTPAKVKPPDSLPMHCITWISPSEGYNVRKAIAWENDRSGKQEWKAEIQNTLKNYEGTWYLSGFSLNETHSDGETSSETVKVIDAWFNRIDPLDAFELKSFGFQPGQNIYDKDTDKTIIFDGDNARVNVAEELAKVASNATPLAPIPGTINYWLVAVCVGAAGVGSFLIFRLLQKGRANAGS